MALSICLGAAILEILCAGTSVRQYLRQLKWPRYSPPLWGWYLIAFFYYAVLFFCAYRILGLPSTAPLRSVTLVLLLSLAILNAVWNLLFFRARNLAATFAFSLFYSAIVVFFLFCLSRSDALAATVLGFYAAYLVYANVWGYRLWRLNDPSQ